MNMFKSLLLSAVLGISAVSFADPAPATAPAAAAQGSQISTGTPGKTTEVTGTTQKSAKPQPKKGGGLLDSGLIPIILMVAVMIFIFSRSNKKQQQKRMQMLDRIVKGTKVLLNSGVYGKIVEVREKEFLVEIAENVRVLVVKNGVATIEEEEQPKKSGDAK